MGLCKGMVSTCSVEHDVLHVCMYICKYVCMSMSNRHYLSFFFPAAVTSHSTGSAKVVSEEKSADDNFSAKWYITTTIHIYTYIHMYVTT